MPLDEWLDSRQLAATLHLSESTVYAWGAQGFGPPRHKIGRSVRYRREDVEAWLAAQREGEATPA